MSHWQETERPHEWLRSLEERADAYTELVRESGNLALAAYRFARAKRRVFDGGDGIPTLRELRAAATMIANRLPEGALESSRALVGDEEQGLCMSERPSRP
ncbi:MAG TPA: hypothetical protein VFZ53_14300 [Polyangiaceae bacterium]